MAKLDVQTLAKSAQIIGEDRLVELKLLQPGIIIGVWKVNTLQAVMSFSNCYSLVSSATSDIENLKWLI